MLLQAICLCSLTALACDRERAERYGGALDPCDVPRGTAQSGETVWRSSGLAASREERFWEPGPYQTWNTAPTAECDANPRTDASAPTPNMALYITYPARSRPTQTGIADVATGPFPVVLFAHANHDRTCQIFDGYYSLHDHWASWGFVVASVDSTSRNCQRGNAQNIKDRAQDQRAALHRLAQLDADPESAFFGRLDLERVVVAGHSRGGGASLLNATLLPDQIDAVINLQGITLQSYGFGTPAIGAPTLGVTAGLDVDLHFPAVEGNEELLAGPYTWVDLAGAVHAWTGDTSPLEFDDDPQLVKEDQQDLTEFFTTAHLAHHIGAAYMDEPAPHTPRDLTHLLYTHQGRKVANARILSDSVRMRWRRPQGEVLIEDFDALGMDALNALGGENQFVGFTRASKTYAYNPERQEQAYHPPAARALWLETLAYPGLFIASLGPTPTSTLDIPASWRLQARVRGRTEWSKPKFVVQLVLQSGEVVELSDVTLLGQAEVSNRYVQLDAPLGPAGREEEVWALAQVRVLVEDGTLILDDLRFSPPQESSPAPP